MSITVTERFKSRAGQAGNSPSAELLYICEGSDDDSAILSALAGACPSSHRGLPQDSRRIEQVGPNLWEGVVTYSKKASSRGGAKLDQGQSSYSFDTAGQTQKITQSIRTVGAYPLASAEGGATPNDNGGLIGVTAEDVEGCDIIVPQFQFSETHVLANDQVTPAYKGKLFRLTGRVNSDTFRTMARGECLFLGASGSARGDGLWEITFRFAGSPNRDDITIGHMTHIQKKGWEYLWVRHDPAVVGSLRVAGRKVTAVYVEQVYEWGNFTELEI